MLLHSTALILSQDVFFAAGSQHKHAIYGNLMVPLYANLGSLPTHILLLPDRFRAAQPLAQWALPASRDVPVTYSLYACEQFRTLPL